jgi:hypothetical protein
MALDLDLEERNSVQDEGGNPPPNSDTVHVNLSLKTIESLFYLAKYRFWSGEAIPGVLRPVFVRVRTAYSNAAT